MDAACTLSQLYFDEVNAEDKAFTVITEALELAHQIQNDSFLCKLTTKLKDLFKQAKKLHLKAAPVLKDKMGQL